MSRRKDTISFSKETKKSKGGYTVNHNGVPVDRKGCNAFAYNAVSHYIPVNKVGRYRPTPHNISDI